MGVVRGLGSTPVLVQCPKPRPPSVTPAVAETEGARSHSRLAAPPAAGTWRVTSALSVVLLLIRTMRVRPVLERVAQILTGPDGALTGSSCAPGGNAWANKSIP